MTETFNSDGVELAYDDLGDGEPVVLVHGFASSRQGTWAETGWYDELAEAGRRVVALDCRGHGDSDKPHDPAAYGHATMASDVVALLDHLEVDRADLMGYSMGGWVTLHLLVDHADRVNAAVAAGVGESLLGEQVNREAIAAALEAEDAGDIEDQTGREFRLFAEQQGNDLRALAALQRAREPAFGTGRLDGVSAPVLVVAGENDELVGDPGPLADVIPGADSFAVPNADHLTATGATAYKERARDFFDREGL